MPLSFDPTDPEFEPRGGRYLLDTNAVIALLAGDLPQPLVQKVMEADWVGISVVTYLEYLTYWDLGPEDREKFEKMLTKTEVLNLDRGREDMMDTFVELRQRFGLPFSDASIAATAIDARAVLITGDRAFEELASREILSIEYFSPAKE